MYINIGFEITPDIGTSDLTETYANRANDSICD